MMTLDHYRGEVKMRLMGYGGGLPPAALVIAINSGIEELRRELMVRNRAAIEDMALLDLVTDKDEVEWPDDAEEILAAERLDMGTEAMPLEIVSTAQRDLARGAYSAFLKGRKIVLRPVPSADSEEGLRVTYIPSHVPLSEGSDVPRLPARFHEFAVPFAVQRVAQFEGARLANPREFRDWSLQMQVRLVQAAAHRPSGARRLRPIGRYGGNQGAGYQPPEGL